MMAAMAWMYVAMDSAPNAGATGGGHHHAPLGGGLALTGTIAATAMVAATVALAWDVLDPPDPDPLATHQQLSAAGSASAGLMSAGMAVMLIQML